MRALVIAAGEGSRMGSLTKDEPKPLIRLLGLSLVERVILTAKEVGIDEFVIVIGHRGKRIKEKLGDGSKFGVKIAYIENTEWERGNGVSVLKAEESFKENFILLMSDHIFDSRILRGLIDYDLKDPVILAVDRREPLPGDTKVLEKKGKIAEIGKDIEKANCIDTGIFLCSPKIFSYIEETVKEGKEELADGIEKVVENRDVKIFDIIQINSYVPSMRKEIQPFWMDIDTEEDLVRARKLLIRNACKGRNDLLATYVNKPIENFIVSRLVNIELTPNQVTIITNIIAYISTFFFIKGNLLLACFPPHLCCFIYGWGGRKTFESKTGFLKYWKNGACLRFSI